MMDAKEFDFINSLQEQNFKSRLVSLESNISYKNSLCSSILQANGIQTLRYPARFDSNQWRFGKRQDFLTKSRLFMWKPALIPDQLYPYVQKQAIPLNFNSYGIQSRPFRSPVQQSYVFAIPTKVNYASYQPMKEIEEKRKPGNLHHVTIINAIMPKPYLPTAPTHSHQATSFQNYRANHKQLYHQYLKNHFGRQNMENFDKINAPQLQLQQQHQPQQIVYPSSSLALQMDKPTIEYMSVKNQNSKINDIENKEYEMNTPVSQCGRQNRDDAKNSASDVFHYYCNNRITNYKNPTQQQLILTQPTTTSTSTSTTTTSETPTTKVSHFDLNIYTTERPIFLPTPNAPLKNSFIPITSATIMKNAIAGSGNGDNFRLQKKYNFENQQEIMSRHEDIKQRQQYTTAATYDNMKLHSFFTIEDAVTRAPKMQVFNDPYQAYRHARRQQTNHQRQTSSTTKMPNTRKPNNKSKFQNFFDDLLDEDYITPKAYTHMRKNQTTYQQHTSATAKIPETITPKIKSFFDDLDDEDYQFPEAHQNDYSLFNIPQKSAFHKSELRSKQQFPKYNQIVDHTEKNELINGEEIFMGRPKIKKFHFELFKSISPTTYVPAAATTYKPNGNFKKLFLTTHKTPSLTTYSSKATTSATTFETELDQKAVTEIENSFLNQVSTTTTLPIITTTGKKFAKITLKPPLNLRSSTGFKYPKQKIHKPYKNLPSTTTKATTAVKKVPKYQRQYKTKKLKQFKHLYTTTSTTTTSTTSTAIPTTIESPTKRVSSTTEEPTTKKSVSSRVFLTTDVPKDKSFRQQSPLTTEVTKRKVRVRTTTASTIKNNDSSIRLRSARRGSKRANVTQSEKETPQVTKSQINKKHIRRLTSSSSTTAKPLLSRTMSGLTSTSAISPTATHFSLRTSSTTTTIKSIMRIPNSKSRKRPHSDIKSTIKTSDEVSDGRPALNGRVLKSTTTMAGIPPLPIEIYFQKSHNSKI